MNLIPVSLRGKGPLKSAQRAASIAKGYGLSPGQMERALRQFVGILHRFECGATFPIVSVVLERSPQLVEYQAEGIEYAIHGHRHVDHFQLSQVEQSSQLALARQLFERLGVAVQGFRGPYLHANADTLWALRKQHLLYDNSQGLGWDVVDGAGTIAYQRALSFYGATSAHEYPSLPDLDGDLVRMPYSLPDDEALVHRLSWGMMEGMSRPWLGILRQSYELGELFALGLHPERILLCQEALSAVLSEARQLKPAVWIACLAEIAAWWKARCKAEVKITEICHGTIQIRVKGPSGTTLLARGVEPDAPTRPWGDGYCQVQATTFTVRASLRPFIGLSPLASPKLASFLWQQGYILERSVRDQSYACYLDQTEFTMKDQRPLLIRLERSAYPLIRLGRWPNGARSALAVTGDIDALTIWDYGLRFVGR